MPIISHLESLIPAGLRPVVAGLAAYGVAEVGTRLLRILAIIVIARQIAPEQIGVAALAIALFELVRVLANSGIGLRIIAASDAELPAICNAARRLFVLWCAAVALIQLAVAALLFAVFGMAEIAAMLVVMSGVYAFMPPGLVQVFLLMREGRMAATARIAASQTAADHVLSIILALFWPSAWAIVLPKLLTTPLWLVLVRRARHWSPVPGVAPAPFAEFRTFSLGVLGSEILVAARTQLAKVIIGALLGTEALGLYFFAFNAGLGITTSFIAALGIVLFPHLCGGSGQRERRNRLLQGGAVSLAMFVPVIAAQMLFADWYVPLLFGAQWTAMAPLVAILCLGGVPAIFGSLLTAWLRANGKPQHDAAVSLVVSFAALASLTAGAGFGLEAAAWSFVAALWLTQIPAALAFVRMREPASPDAALKGA